MALLASRAYSNAAASASAVFRSSSRLLTKACAAASVRAAILSSPPSGSFSVSSRSLKLRSLSMAICAACKPSKVKFNDLR